MKTNLLLCLDIGNSHTLGGVYDDDSLRCTFRKSTQAQATADELGVFFTAVLGKHGLAPAQIGRMAVCSVVPAAVHAVQEAAAGYFGLTPFLLQAGVKTGLKVLYRNPHEVGADRIANAVGAIQRHPGRDVLVVDCGTATTFDVVLASGDYLGGAIIPGVGTSAAALAGHTARLPHVQIVRPESPLGRTTAESINAGLYHGHAGAIRHLQALLTAQAFGGRPPVVIGTGGYAPLFGPEKLFDEVVPELVLQGLRQAERLNREPAPRKE